ncbi:hypothetical protein C1645_473392 [Glomus cerebriforme]|uniref:Uncharacterized protein n=1 Tax=Glomus cerebriforme TaxID=658196 RepID=A0A397TE50_9GLOM|nr:hypothetical protein C1645_473392 [Glomus cerebriforme]
MERKRQEQRNKENHKESNQEVVDFMQDGDIDEDSIWDDISDNQMDIDKNDKNDDRINSEDNLKQVLEKYCQNMNDDIKRKSLSLEDPVVKKDPDVISNFNSNFNSNQISNSNSKSISKSIPNVKNNVKTNFNISRKSKIIRSFPPSKPKLIKINPIQPSIMSNSSIKSNISILEPSNNEISSMDIIHFANKPIRGKKISLPSKSERISLLNINKRELDSSNNNSSTKRQRTEDVYDVNSKNNTINSSINANEKVKDSRILPSSSSNVKNKRISSQSNGTSPQSNKNLLDDNLSNSQSIPIYNISSAQISNQVQTGVYHVNSEIIKALASRSSKSSSSSSSNPPKFRPIAAKVSPSQSNNYNDYTNVYNTRKLPSNSNNSRTSNRLASIRNPIHNDNFPKNDSDKNVPISTTSAQHTSYFHKSYVQSTSTSPTTPTTLNNNNTQFNLENLISSQIISSNKQSSTTNDQPNQNIEMDNNDLSFNHPFYKKLRDPTLADIDLWMNDWVKSMNDTLEKEKHDLIKEKNILDCWKIKISTRLNVKNIQNLKWNIQNYN